MTDRAALLAAVCADPDDDLPRLAFADWLDDHGDPGRAEFIRLQCELARLPADQSGDCGRLSERIDALAADNTERWLEELPQAPSEFGWSYRNYDRGFPTTLFVVNSSRLTPALFAAAPIVRLSVVRVDSVEALTRIPPPGRVREAMIHTLDDSTARQLLDWLTGPQLRRVWLQLQRLSPHLTAELSARLAGRLRRLLPNEPHPNVPIPGVNG